MTLNEIKRPVADHLSRFEPYFQQNLESPNRLLTLVTNHVFRRKGKQMRPLLVFLSGAAAGEVCEATYAAATLIELLHNASLVHDDVVDETYMRRGQWSVMGLWDNKIAVLVGDFFLSRGMDVALKGGYVEILKIVSKAVGELAQGELSQIEHARRLDITEESYYEVIRQKTATLIEACTRAGATSVGGSAEAVGALSSYGNNLGLAFQIRDDIFDYAPTGLTGKPSLNDIKEQKITLPLIHALRECSDKERREMVGAIRRHAKDVSTGEMAMQLVRKYGGLEYSQERIEYFSNLATKDLDALPESEAREALRALVDYNRGRGV